MTWFKSAIFNAFFYVWTAIISVSALLVMPLPYRFVVLPQRAWSHTIQFVMRHLVGIKVSIENKELHLPDTPCIIACMHQSTWETTIFHGQIKYPTLVVKRELLMVPFFGWYTWRLGMISVDRRSGGKALKQMIRIAKKRIEQGRQIVIFPEGTRVDDGEDRPFRSGVFALYHFLKIPVIPVALNSGQFWPRSSMIRTPGTIRLMFLPPIEPGLSKDAFMERIQTELAGAVKEMQPDNSGP